MEPPNKPYRRPHHTLLAERLEEPIHYIEVLMGPRQVGKTTLVKQLIQQTPGRYHYASADSPLPRDATWIEQQWNVAKKILYQRDDAVLVLDEINKVPHWAETVKTLWDRDRMEDRPLRVVLLGSAPICWHVQAEQGPEFTTGEKETEKWILFLSRVAGGRPSR